MSGIPVLEDKLRNLINRPRRHTALFQNGELFSQLCSALDALGDTEQAIDAYLASERRDLETGERYIYIYGLLQALYVQQDAVEHIAQALGSRYTRRAGLRKVREVRNDATGHPTRRNRSKKLAFNHISRQSISWRSFELFTFRSGQPTQHRTIDLVELIDLQKREVLGDLQRIVEAERMREIEHRRRFREDPLSACFPIGLDYSLQKLDQEIRDSRPLGIAPQLIPSIHEVLNCLENKLTARDELPAVRDVVDDHAAPARNALRRLEQFFTAGATEALAATDAESFLLHLKQAIDGLRQLAREFDLDYESDP